jgi:hypothetical protein
LFCLSSRYWVSNVFYVVWIKFFLIHALQGFLPMYGLPFFVVMSFEDKKFLEIFWGSTRLWTQGLIYTIASTLSFKLCPQQKFLIMMKYIVLVRFLSLHQNTWESYLKRRKSLFWLTVSVHGHLISSFWAWGVAEHHNGECCGAQMLNSWMLGH